MNPVNPKIYKVLSFLLTALIISSLLLLPSATQAAPLAQESDSDSANKAYLPVIAVVGDAETAAVPLLPEEYSSEDEEAPTLAEEQVQSATCFTYIKFTNSSSYPINIYWVNYSGGETLYKTLSSGKYYWQLTYYGHNWRVRSSSGALLKSYAAYTCSSVYITITNSDFPQPTATPVPATGSIGDLVWNDSNRNGVQDNGEAGIAGVSVALWVDNNNDGAHDTLVGTTTTNSNGNYSFTGLNPSKRYVVKFTLPSCYAFTSANVGSDATDSDVTVLSYSGTDLISLTPNANTVDVDAGMYNSCQPTPTNTPVPPTPTNTTVPSTPTNTPVPPTPTTPPTALGSIGNKVWNDINANGILDGGEVGVSGVSVQLKDCNGAVLRTVTTDSNGNYGFNNLAAGCYLVTVVLPNGFQFSPKDQGNNEAVDSDANPANGTTDQINLAAGLQLFTVDIGIYQKGAPTATPTNTPGALGSIGNKVWNDINANGILDGGEVGVSGVSVQLKDCNGAVLRTVTTDSNGNYGFNKLAAGCYLVTVVLPNGFQFSPKDVGGDDAVDSDVNPANGTTDQINLTAGQQIFTVDIGIYQLATPTPTNTAVPPTPTNTAVPPTPTHTPTPAVGSIGNLVWKDINRNGVQDNGEPGIGGISVALWVDSNNDGVHDTLVGTTMTNSNGNYSFTGLNTSKRYVVKFSLPSCYSFTTPNVGSDATDSDVTVFSYGGTDLISLAPNAHTVDVDAGMYKCY